MRIKLLLVAITMIAAVGGTLAFKASKSPFAKAFICTPQQTCQVVGPDNPTTTVSTAVGRFTITRSWTIAVVDVEGEACNNELAPCTIPPTAYIIAEQ